MLRIFDSSARPLELNEESLYEGKELKIEHSKDNLKLILNVARDAITLNFEDSFGLFVSVSLSDSHGEVVVKAREINLLDQRYGEMAIRNSSNEIEIETTCQFNAMLGGKLDRTVKCRLARQ